MTNNGNIAWLEDTKLCMQYNKIENEIFNEFAVCPNGTKVAPGESKIINMKIKAPEDEGEHIYVYQLENS